MHKKIVLFIVFLFYLSLSFLNFEVINLNEEKLIKVEIKGYVQKPGVYEIKKGLNVEDILNEALILENADISNIDLASTLYNGQIIVIPELKENTDKLVSLNSATLDELMTLPGIGETVANRIIEYRKNYSFHNIEELKNVKGIGEKKFEKLKEYITL